MTHVFWTVHRTLPKMIHDAVDAITKSEGVKQKWRKRPRGKKFVGVHLERIKRVAEENKRLGLSTKAYRDHREQIKKLPVGVQQAMRVSHSVRKNRKAPTLPKLKCLEPSCDE